MRYLLVLVLFLILAGCGSGGNCATTAEVSKPTHCGQSFTCGKDLYRWDCACNSYLEGKIYIHHACECYCGLFGDGDKQGTGVVPASAEGETLCSYGLTAAREALVADFCPWLPTP